MTTWTLTHEPTGNSIELEDASAETVEYDRSRVTFTVDADERDNSVLAQAKRVAGETQKDFVAPGEWRASGDVAGNKFTVAPPADRTPSYSGTVYVEGYDETRLDARGARYEVKLEYLHAAPPSPETVTQSADGDEWLFDFAFTGAVATSQLDLSSITEDSSDAATVSVTLILGPDQAAHIHTVPTFLEQPDDDRFSPPVELVERESADNFYIDTTPDSRNSMTVVEPSGNDRGEKLFPPGEYAVLDWTSEWLGNVYRVTLDLGGRRTIDSLARGFEVSITGTNSPVAAGSDITVDYAVENTADEQDTQDIRFTIDGQEIDRESDVTLGSGATTTGTFAWDTSGEGDGTIAMMTVRSDDTSASVTVGTTQADPLFVVEALTIGDVVAGGVVSATATVANFGSTQGTQPVTFAALAGGSEAHSVTKEVTIAGGSSDTVILPWDTDPGDAGSYTGEVSTDASTLTDGFEVQEAFTDFSVNVVAAGQQSQSADPCVPSGDLVNVDIVVTNTGTVAGTQDLELTVAGEGVVDTREDLFLDPGEQSGTITLQWNTSDSAVTGPTTVEGCSQDSCDQGSVTVLDSDTPCFDVDITGTSADGCTFIGATVDVTADIANNGTGSGEQTVALLVDGVQEDSATVQLAQDASTTLTFQWDTSGYAGDETATACVESDNDDDCTDIVVALDDAALFEVSVTGTNSPVVAGNDITLDIEVANRGGAQGTQTVTVTDETTGEEVYSNSVTLNGCTAGASPDTFIDTVTVSTSALTPQLPDDQDVTLGERVFTLASEDGSAEQAVTVTGTDVRVAITSLSNPAVAGQDQEVSYEAVNRGTDAATQDIVLNICDDGQPDIECQGTLVANPADVDGGQSLPVDDHTTGTLSWATSQGDAQTIPYSAELASADRKTNAVFAVGEAPPQFFAVSITGTNSPVNQGEDLLVNADITNTGTETASQLVVLSIGLRDVDGQSVELDPGQTESITLAWTFTENATAGEKTATVASVDDTDGTAVTVVDSNTLDMTCYRDTGGQTDQQLASFTLKSGTPSSDTGVLMRSGSPGYDESYDTTTQFEILSDPSGKWDFGQASDYENKTNLTIDIPTSAKQYFDDTTGLDRSYDYEATVAGAGDDLDIRFSYPDGYAGGESDSSLGWTGGETGDDGLYGFGYHIRVASGYRDLAGTGNSAIELRTPAESAAVDIGDGTFDDVLSSGDAFFFELRFS